MCYMKIVIDMVHKNRRKIGSPAQTIIRIIFLQNKFPVENGFERPFQVLCKR